MSIQRTFAAVFLMVVWSAAFGQSAEGVRAAITAWEEAYADKENRADIYKMYAEDAVLWGTSLRKPAQGHDAIRKYFARSSKGPGVTLNFDDASVLRVVGDSAVASGIYMVGYKNKEGELKQAPARYTMVFQNIGGAWRITAHHSSRMPKKKKK